MVKYLLLFGRTFVQEKGTKTQGSIYLRLCSWWLVKVICRGERKRVTEKERRRKYKNSNKSKKVGGKRERKREYG